jgi:putative serine protease PepD
MDGRVVGINVASRELQNSDALDMDEISFAIDGNTVVGIADQIIGSGSANRPFLGVTGEIGSDGHLVRDVESDSPADAAGLQPGDVITGIDGLIVNEDGWFIDLLYQYSPEDMVMLTIDRDGEVVQTEATLGRPPSGP